VSPNVREPTTLLYGQHFTISEICHLVDSFTDPLPETILEILYVARDSMSVDGSALKSNQTYQGGSRHLRQLMRAQIADRTVPKVGDSVVEPIGEFYLRSICTERGSELRARYTPSVRQELQIENIAGGRTISE
jgi:hypothetical protein